MHPGLVCDAPLGHVIGNVLNGPGNWNRGQGKDAGSETWWLFCIKPRVRGLYRERCRGPIRKASSLNLPQRGNAYQLRASLWEPHPREEVCSEGTPHRVGRGRCPRHGEYAAFLQNAGLFFRAESQGWHPGLVCDAPSEHRIGTWCSISFNGAPPKCGAAMPVGGRTRDRKRYRSMCLKGATSTQCDALP